MGEEEEMIQTIRVHFGLEKGIDNLHGKTGGFIIAFPEFEQQNVQTYDIDFEKGDIIVFLKSETFLSKEQVFFLEDNKSRGNFSYILEDRNEEI